MSAPEKPWESYSKMQEQGIGLNKSSGDAGPGRNVLNSNCPQPSIAPLGTVRSMRTTALPPLPPRPPQLSGSMPSRPLFGMPSGMYGGYSGYSGYGGYSSYGSYPGSMYGGYPGSYGYGSYGQPNAFENRFLQAAEESSRNAFQSIESLVRAFTSVSMMLESTYHAMYSSFRAILGVVDNFSRLRQLFSQFLSAITFLKIIQNFYRRLLYWLGIIKQDPQADRIWNSVAAGGGANSTSSSSSWPLFTFLGLLFGGPYLVSKFFSSTTLEPKKWDPKKGQYFQAAYSYEAPSDAELSFKENELINVAPAELQLPNGGEGWLLAANRQWKTGYVPVTRLGTRAVRISQRTNTPSKDAINPALPN